MSKGVSAILATVLIVLVVISLSGAFLIYSQRAATQLTESATTQQQTLLQQADVKFSIDGVADSKIFVKNTGEKNITNGVMSIFLDDILMNYTLPVSISPGTTGTVYLNQTWRAGLGEHTLRVVAGSLFDSVRVRTDRPENNILDLRFDESRGNELLINGDFETDLSGWINGTEFYRTVAQKHSGIASAQFDASSGWMNQTVVMSAGGTEYVVSGWVRTIDRTSGDAFVHLDGSTIATVPPGKNWTYFSALILGNGIGRNVALGSTGGSGQAQYDGMSVVKLDSSKARDDSGKGNDGTLINGTLWSEGKFRRALYFDGIDDHVQIGDVDAIDGLTQMTVELWINPSVIGGSTHGVVKYDSCGGGGQPGGFQFHPFSSGKLRFFLADSSDNRLVAETTASPMATDSWQHVIATFDGSLSPVTSRMKIYYNGADQPLSYTNTFAHTTVPSTTRPVRIGGTRDSACNWNVINGAIDEVRIYGRAYAPDQLYVINKA